MLGGDEALPQPRDHRAAPVGRIPEECFPGATDAFELVQIVARLGRLRHQVDERLPKHLRRRRRVGAPRPVGGDDVLDANVFARSTNLGASPALWPDVTPVTRNIGGTSAAARRPIAY